MQRRKLLSMATSVTILGLLLGSCAPATAPIAATPSSQPPAVSTAVPKNVGVPPLTPTPALKPAAEEPRYGGILNISHVADPISYDPIQEATVQSLSPIVPCYSGIVQHDPLENTKVVGDLAEKWELSSDGLAYTFHLYKNVKWHDGTPVTAEDARFALEVTRKPPKGVVSTRSEWLNAVDRIEALDKDTLKITLQYASASFLHNLGDGRMVIVPKHVFEAKGNMKRDVVGTGPYRFKSFIPGASVSVVKNQEYFIKGRPYLDQINWYVIRDAATRFAAFRTRRVEVTSLGSYGLTPSQSETVGKDLSDKIALDRYPSLAFNAIRMPHTKFPWSDVRVRRAVDIAIDRPNLIKVACEGVADLGGFMPPGIWSLPDEEFKRLPGWRQPKEPDIAEAKRLLAEAGYAQGMKITAITRDTQEYESSAIAFKEQMAKIGIDVTVKVVDAATVLDLLYKRNFDIAVYGGTAAYDDPDQVFGQNFITGVTRNFEDFSDEKVDKWYEEQSRALNPAKRKEIVLNMQRRMSELVASSMAYWKVFQLGRWKEVKGYKAGIGLYNNLKFQNVWLER